MGITVTDLAIAPVKGMRLMPADEVELTPRGAAGDRAFVLVEADGGLVTTERNPALLAIAPAWDAAAGTLSLRLPDGAEVSAAPVPGEPAETSFYDGRRVTGRLVNGPFGEALSEHLGRPVRLLALDPAQRGADDFPVTIMSTASLAVVGDALGAEALDARRFRMTVTVDGAEAWEENGWAGGEVTLGEATVRVAEPVPRCVVTTRDPDRGRTDMPVLRALAGLRGKKDVTFGVWCEVTRPGRVRVGDLVSPTPASSP